MKESGVDLNELMNNIQQLIQSHKDNLFRILGMQLYQSSTGFTQEQIYNYAGAMDSVTTLTIRPGSVTEKTFGNLLTVVFVYFIKEREELRTDRKSLNESPNVKAKDLLYQLDDHLSSKLLNEGIPTCDIVEMLVAPSTEDNNTYESQLLRTPKTLDIDLKLEENGDDIGWVYGAYCHFISDGISLSPEEYADYLACKLILQESLTKEEKDYVFNENGAIADREVAICFLRWKEVAGVLKEKDRTTLNNLRFQKIADRFSLADKELQNMGLSFVKLKNQYPDKANLLLDKIIYFREERYNITGKHLLYLSFESMIHIYLRHVQELSVPNQYMEKDKFQLAEKDLKETMRKVLIAINDEYQSFRDIDPDRKFIKRGKRAYYYNGDYYDIYINPNGQIETFYKRRKP